jgi:hypothetical protein
MANKRLKISNMYRHATVNIPVAHMARYGGSGSVTGSTTAENRKKQWLQDYEYNRDGGRRNPTQRQVPNYNPNGPDNDDQVYSQGWDRQLGRRGNGLSQRSDIGSNRQRRRKGNRYYRTD